MGAPKTREVETAASRRAKESLEATMLMRSMERMSAMRGEKVGKWESGTHKSKACWRTRDACEGVV